MKNNTLLFKILFVLILPIMAHAQTVLTLDQTISLTQDMSTTLRTEINLTSPAQITIYVKDWQNTLNWDTDFDRIYIYNSADTAVAYNQFASEADPFLFHMIGDSVYLVTNIGKEGTYYIDFHSGNDWGWPDGKTTQNYTVKVSALPVNDAYEPNDSFADAKSLALNQTVTASQWKRTASSSVRDDEDWYQITLPSPGKLTVTLTDWLSVYNWGTDYDRFFIYNAQQEAIGGYSTENPYFAAMFQDTPDGIHINLTSDGTYYLRFHSGNAYKTEPYSLTASFISVDDPFEPNDERADAAPVDFDITYPAYQWRSLGASDTVWTDEDYYTVNVSEAGKLTVTVSDGWNSIYNWGTDYDRLYFYDEAGNPLGASGGDPNHSMFSGKEMSINLPDSGKYLVRLHSGNAYSENPYDITFKFKGLSGIHEGQTVPDKYKLAQNYPNPFNPYTTIRYQLSAVSEVRLTVYNALGQKVGTLVNERQKAGSHQVIFDATHLSSGIYYYKLQTASGYNEIKRMLLIE